MYSITSTFHNGKDKTSHTTELMDGKETKQVILGMIDFEVITKEEAKTLIKDKTVNAIRPRSEMAPWCADGAYHSYTLNIV